METSLIKPMLLQKSENPPAGNYIHQLKYDGHRGLLYYDKTGIRLFTRHTTECTKQYPEMQCVKLNADSAVLDGEVIVLEEGKPCFESVMRRFQTSKPYSIKRLSNELPAVFVAWDILRYNGKKTTGFPLEERLELLEKVVEQDEHISVCQSFDDGAALFEATKKMCLEGIVSKKRGSFYYEDARPKGIWYKTKHYSFATATIRGLRKGEFGWLLSVDDRYVGVLEFAPPDVRQALYRVSRQIITSEDDKWTFLEPRIRVQVKFQSWTKQQLMRSPSFDKFIY